MGRGRGQVIHSVVGGVLNVAPIIRKAIISPVAAVVASRLADHVFGCMQRGSEIRSNLGFTMLTCGFECFLPHPPVFAWMSMLPKPLFYTNFHKLIPRRNQFSIVTVSHLF